MPKFDIAFGIWKGLSIIKNNICKEIIEYNDNYYILYKMINQLYLCKPEFVEIVFNKKNQNLIMMILINF